MKTTGIIIPIDNLGRLVLPAELRYKFGVKEGGSFEIFVNDDQIILKNMKPPVFSAAVIKMYSLLKNAEFVKPA